MKRLLTILSFLAIAAPLQAQLVFQPQLTGVIEFEDTPVGETSEIRVNVTNQSRSAFAVELQTEDPFSLNPANFNIPGGQQANFTMRFSPRQAGEVERRLTGRYFNMNQQGQINATLRGTGTGGGEPDIGLDQDTLELFIFVDELGSVWDVTEWNLVVSNAGDAELQVASVSPGANWLTAAPNRFNLAAGEEQAVTVAVPAERWEAMEPGIYRTTLTINSNDPDQGRLIVPVIFDRGFIPNYLVVLGDELPAANHAILVDQAVIVDDEMQEFDEVGVFTPRGDLAGSGWFAGEWPIAVLAWGEDQQNGFPGFREGERFVFKLWDHSAEHEYDAEVEWLEGPETFEEDGLSAVALMSAPDEVEQEIQLRRGWNFVSLAVVPAEEYWAREEGPDVRRIFEPVREAVELVKDGSGRFYAPPFNDFNNIPYWLLQRGMQVKVSRDVVLVVRGRPIDPGEEISLTRGWSIVAYYPTVEMTMAEAFGELVAENNLLIAKNVFGQFYLPRFNFGGGTVIRPGEAAMVNVSRDCAFSYPAGQGFAPPRRDDENVIHFPKPGPTDGNMSLLIDSLAGIPLREGAEVAALTPEGKVAGAHRVDETGFPIGIALWGDDSQTQDTTEGFKPGDAIRLIYWDPQFDEELQVGYSIVEGRANYQVNGFLHLGYIAVGVGNEPSAPAIFDLSEPFPNPFNNRTSVTVSLPSDQFARLTLTEAASGREVRRLYSGRLEAGESTFTIEADDLGNGVYLLSLQTENRNVTRKLLLVK